MDLAKVTPADRRILAARKSLQERCAALEDRVTETVERAAGTVDRASSEIRGTVTDATTSVKSLFESTSENFHGALDLRTQLREHPWAGVLLAVGAGFAARLIASRTAPKLLSDAPLTTGSASPLAELGDVVRRELIGLGKTAVDAASKRLRENIATITLPAKSEAVNSISHRNGVS